MSGNKNTLPNFLKAKTADKLRRLIALNNARLYMVFVAYQYLHDGKNFYAFYNEPFAEIKELDE